MGGVEIATRGMSVSPDLVSVVVPAYNAEATLGETLDSVRAQTWTELEIIVVDDGSTDRTLEIAADHAHQDPRIRVVRQVNGGVAAARNHGIEQARGEFVAPVDADDLWAPEKIALQMAVMRAGGEAMGLVYSWYAHIDAEGRRSPHVISPTFEGRVFREMCRVNFVGNGSSALMRRKIVLEAGGYDASLRARDAEGCEDIMLYMSIAERYEIGLVREPVVGYRVTATNMSSKVLNMYRSAVIVFEQFERQRPDVAAELSAHHDHTLYWLVIRALLCGKLRDAFTLARLLVARRGLRGMQELRKTGPFLIYALMPNAVREFCRRISRRLRAPRPRFLAGSDGRVA